MPRTALSLTLRPVTRGRILLLYALPALLLLGGTLPFLFHPELDLQISRRFFVSGANLWPYAEKQPWVTLYKFGTLPALLTAVLAFCVLILGIGRPRLAPWRKVSAYLVVTLVVGPGLIANNLLKDQWGRPRPREVVELGGRQQFEPLLTIDPASTGYSFVSGHSTMGFYFFAVALVVFGAGRRKSGALLLLAALLFGSLIGTARLLQGGHFASDVLWAAGVVWFTAAGLFPAFGLHRGIRYLPARPVGIGLRPWVPTVLLIGLLTVISAVCLAWPYSRLKKTTLLDERVELLPDIVVLKLDLEGTLEFVPGDEILLVTESRGAGFPNSSLANNRIFIPDGAEVVHDREGWFRTLQAHTRLTLPPNRVYHITIGKRITAVYYPPTKREPAAFAHVRLTIPLGSPVTNLRARVLDEDFFGRTTRAFSF